MKKNILFLSFVVIVAFSQSLLAQSQITTSSKTYHIAVFAPLYLDSAFSNGQMTGSNPLPKFIMPAVEFVQGAHIALDTLSPDGKSADATIYDSKSYTQPISWLIKYKKLDNTDLIIGSVKDPDYRELADFALQKNIPFISATYPNDGGVLANPFLFIVN
jgi:hypothetical protein